MDFRYTTEQDLYRQSIREWLVKNLEPRARSIDEAEDGIPDDIVEGMQELGIFGVTDPRGIRRMRRAWRRVDLRHDHHQRDRPC